MIFDSFFFFFSPSECEASEASSGEADHDTSDPEDSRHLPPGALLYIAARARNIAVMAEALAHGADVNMVNKEDQEKTPLIQAVIGVRTQCDDAERLCVFVTSWTLSQKTTKTR